MSDDTPSLLNNVITIDDERIKSHLDRVVRGTVEETLNALLDAEADRLCNAQRYERSEARRDTRAGHYERGMQTNPRLSQLCPPCARPSFNSSLDHRNSDARAAENGFAEKSSVNKSAKVVLD